MTTQPESASTRPDRRFVGAAGVRPDGTPILTISVCPRCAARWFPPREICATCAHDELDPVEAGTAGVVYASTVVRIGAPGFATPYVLSYVDIDGVRVLSHTDAAPDRDPEPPAPGTPVTLTAGPVGTAGEVELWSYRAHDPAAPERDR